MQQLGTHLLWRHTRVPLRASAGQRAGQIGAAGPSLAAEEAPADTRCFQTSVCDDISTPYGLCKTHLDGSCDRSPVPSFTKGYKYSRRDRRRRPTLAVARPPSAPLAS